MWAIFSTSYTCTSGSNSNSPHIADDLSAAVFFLNSISAFRRESDAVEDENWVMAGILPHKKLNSPTPRCRDRARWLTFKEYKRNHSSWYPLHKKKKAHFSRLISDWLNYCCVTRFLTLSTDNLLPVKLLLKMCRAKNDKQCLMQAP